MHACVRAYVCVCVCVCVYFSHSLNPCAMANLMDNTQSNP